MTLQIYIQFWKDIFVYWWPVIILIAMGLVAIYFDERRDKHGRNSNN